MKALILLGCPESPSQIPLALYASNKLANLGYDVTVASNPAASKLLEVSDPDSHYIQNRMDIEKCLDNLNLGDYDLLLGFVHKDAAASFFITFYYILQTKSIALIFEKDMELLEEFEAMIRENTDAEIVMARAYHNPTPIRVRLDKALNSLND